MPSVVVSDTSCFIVLTKINQLDILHQLYGQVLTTPEVVQEFRESLPSWIQVISPSDRKNQKSIALILDSGEASAISLAMEFHGCTIILDDVKARAYANKMGLKVTGTLGILIKAKHAGFITSIKPVIDSIKKTDFYISDELESQILRLAEE